MCKSSPFRAQRCRCWCTKSRLSPATFAHCLHFVLQFAFGKANAISIIEPIAAGRLTKSQNKCILKSFAFSQVQFVCFGRAAAALAARVKRISAVRQCEAVASVATERFAITFPSKWKSKHVPRTTHPTGVSVTEIEHNLFSVFTLNAGID